MTGTNLTTRAPRLTDFAGLAPLGVLYTRRQIARMEAEGRFPKRVPIGGKKTAWVTAEVIALVDGWIAARDGGSNTDLARGAPQRKTSVRASAT